MKCGKSENYENLINFNERELSDLYNAVAIRESDYFKTAEILKPKVMPTVNSFSGEFDFTFNAGKDIDLPDIEPSGIVRAPYLKGVPGLGGKDPARTPYKFYDMMDFESMATDVQNLPETVIEHEIKSIECRKNAIEILKNNLELPLGELTELCNVFGLKQAFRDVVHTRAYIAKDKSFAQLDADKKYTKQIDGKLKKLELIKENFIDLNNYLKKIHGTRIDLALQNNGKVPENWLDYLQS
ncbi:MAG: hypothetical protein LBG88_00555 [Christensenellaceae bacterium]|jgi:hypothetical protein|nr:hypothetical protein [Christensenellaceae bacterium]